MQATSLLFKELVQVRIEYWRFHFEFHHDANGSCWAELETFDTNVMGMDYGGWLSMLVCPMDNGAAKHARFLFSYLFGYGMFFYYFCLGIGEVLDGNLTLEYVFYDANVFTVFMLVAEGQMVLSISLYECMVVCESKKKQQLCTINTAAIIFR